MRQIITLTGRLTDDAELRSSIRQGVKNEFVSFTLAVNESIGDEETSTFYDVTMGKSGIFDYLKKGTMVSLIGRFRFIMQEDKEKKKQYPHLNVRVMDIELVGGKKETPQQEEAAPAPHD